MSKFVFTSDFSNKLSRLALGERQLSDSACKAVEIFPACEIAIPCAIFNKADLHKVTGVGMGTTMAYELARIRSGTAKHKATIAYELRDVTLMNGALYKWRFKHGIAYSGDLHHQFGRVESIDDAGVLAHSWLGSRYFGHWIRDDMPLAMLATTMGKSVGIDRKCTTHQKRFAEIFSVHVETLPPVAHLSKIVVLSDSHYNQGKITRWREMRERIAQRKGKNLFKGVMLLRGATGEARVLLNEAEIAQRMSALGFYVANPAEVDLDTFIENAAGAEIVISVEGSQLANGFVCMKETGTMLVLQPPFRFNNIYKDACDALGTRYAFVVGDAKGQGFTVDVDAVERMVDQISGQRVVQS